MLPDLVQQPRQLLLFIGIQTIEQATDPLCVLVKQCLGQAFSPCGQYDLQATAILSIAATLQQFFALQAIEQAADAVRDFYRSGGTTAIHINPAILTATGKTVFIIEHLDAPRPTA